MTNDEERELLPFSGSQKELWLSSQTSLSEYNEIAIRVCFFVKNKVSPERVKEAIRVALQYTPLLSASLCRDEKEPCFKIGGCEEIDFRFFDACSETNSTQAARQYIEDFFEESVDEQLIRFALIHTAKSESIYAVKCSHLISDGLSMFFHVNFVADI